MSCFAIDFAVILIRRNWQLDIHIFGRNKPEAAATDAMIIAEFVKAR